MLGKMEPAEFNRRVIDRWKASESETCMEVVLALCEELGIDPSIGGGMVDDTVKELIQMDAIDLNLIRKGRKLPFEGD